MIMNGEEMKMIDGMCQRLAFIVYTQVDDSATEELEKYLSERAEYWFAKYKNATPKQRALLGLDLVLEMVGAE